MNTLSRTISSADSIAPKQVGRPFQPGQSGNPAGRPIGSRNKLCQDFIADLAEVHSRLGKAAIERVAEQEPAKFMSIVAGLMPRNLDMTLAVSHDLVADVSSYLQAFRMARDYIGAEQPILLVEAKNGQ